MNKYSLILCICFMYLSGFSQDAKYIKNNRIKSLRHLPNDSLTIKSNSNNKPNFDNNSSLEYGNNNYIKNRRSHKRFIKTDTTIENSNAKLINFEKTEEYTSNSGFTPLCKKSQMLNRDKKRIIK